MVCRYYRMIFLGRNFLSGRHCTLKPKKNFFKNLLKTFLKTFKNLKTWKLFPKKSLLMVNNWVRPSKRWETSRYFDICIWQSFFCFYFTDFFRLLDLFVVCSESIDRTCHGTARDRISYHNTTYHVVPRRARLSFQASTTCETSRVKSLLTPLTVTTSPLSTVRPIPVQRQRPQKARRPAGHVLRRYGDVGYASKRVHNMTRRCSLMPTL